MKASDVRGEFRQLDAIALEVFDNPVRQMLKRPDRGTQIVRDPVQEVVEFGFTRAVKAIVRGLRTTAIPLGYTHGTLLLFR